VNPRDPARIADEYEKLRTRQDYSPRPRIDGVVLRDLRRFVEDAGEFQELARLGPAGELPEFPGFHVRQVNYSVMEPGAVKAFHLHHTQEDVWFVPPQSKLVVGLLDCREGSPTKGVSMRLVLGDGRSQLLYIPRGVAHGAANVTTRPAVILYFVNQHFRAEDTDESRLPWNVLGDDFFTPAKG
jgi:dTDP-4-dehydrorhamnose 3,5-epimerase-like enzyme